MTEPHEELLQIADRLDRLAKRRNEENIRGPLDALEQAATEIGKAWSGSWIGYHAIVYYAKLEPPPPGAHFSAEWGIRDRFLDYSTGDWQEYDADQLEAAIRNLAGNPELDTPRQIAEESVRAFEDDKSEVLSIFTTELSKFTDSFLERLKEGVEKLSIISRADVIRGLRPGSYTSRDSLAMHQGIWTPPHYSVLSEVISLRHPLKACGTLGELARKAGSHLSRQRRQRQRAETVGTNVFIGHGRSLIWRELKDFIEDRLKLPADEFNRVPAAGVVNIARLLEMLDAAAIAFLIMTGEDEQPDGKLRARMNVVHEAGLFQGRLGFTRAIVVLEEGCEAFSNIEGLGQIRFPKDNIKAAFEEIREVLEREGLLSVDE